MARNKPNRRSIRLKGYDYTQPGAYFITICTHQRRHLFGEVVNGEMRLNALGKIARQCWAAIPDHFPHTALDEFVIMPNHIHGIIWIEEKPDNDSEMVGATHASPPPQQPEPPRGAKPQSIGAIIGSFKSAVTKRINALHNTPGVTVWQRNYYEHIIRTDRALHAIRQYIVDNPLRWHLDRYNENAVGRDPRAVEIWQIVQTPQPFINVRAKEMPGERTGVSK